MNGSVHPPLPQLDLPAVEAWSVYWTEIARRTAPVFARTRAMAYLAGLVSPCRAYFRHPPVL